MSQGAEALPLMPSQLWQITESMHASFGGKIKGDSNINDSPQIRQPSAEFGRLSRES